MNSLYGYQAPQPTQDDEFLKRLLQLLMGGQASPVADFSLNSRQPMAANPRTQETMGNSIVMQALRNGPRMGYGVKTPGADMMHIDDDIIDAASAATNMRKPQWNRPQLPPATPEHNRNYGI